MGIMLQPKGTLRCKLARQFVLVAIYHTIKFFFAIAHENPHLQTFATTKTFQQSTKTLTMKPQIIPDLWGLQPEVANQQQTK
jgi:hypothetical protein